VATGAAWDNPLMCGRFVQSQPPDWYARFFSVDSILTEALEPSYNVAPTDPVYAVVQHDSERRLATFRWGLLPFWAKDRSMAARNINARAETVADKAAFRESFAGRRCIIPADGFYEWQVVAKGKLPHYIYGRDGGALALAGLWASWRDPGTQERVRTCTIITGEPNELVAPLHDRMPVVLPQGAWDEWLDPGNDDTDGLMRLMQPYPAPQMVEHPVSTLVNKVANNVPELIDPLTTPAADQLSL
jgi:putative SOS response-associated peptidase YedK